MNHNKPAKTTKGESNEKDLNPEMNNKRFSKLFTFYDKVLIISLLIFSIALSGIFALYKLKTSDDIIVVRQNGTVILQLAKEEIDKGGIYTFTFDGGKGQIEIKDKRVRMLPMDQKICPRAICSNTGWIDGSPQTIVCLPNRIVVSFKNNNQDSLGGIAF